jgi:hypothetical protein
MAAPLSQSLSSFAIPSTERSDPDSVRSSLARAREEFERGELREALKLLRRAAEGADAAGSDLRAVALARAAADLATEVSASMTPPPVSVDANAATRSSGVTAAAAPFHGNPAPEVASTSSPGSTSASIVTAPPTAAPPTVAPRSSGVAPSPTVRVSLDASLQDLLSTGRAVKVAIKRSARDEGLYVVRTEEAHAHGLGTREALIVLLEPDQDFFTGAGADSAEPRERE